MSVRHYGLLNLGRDKRPGTTQRLDRTALIKLRTELGAEQAAAFLVEINEGDDNNELALAIDVFDGWELYGRGTREPVFLSPDQPRARAEVFWVPDSAVEHWSPQRSVLEIDLADEPETLFAYHCAAGPFTAGTRPKRYRKPLRTSWENTHELALERKRLSHRRGRNGTEMVDLNHYHLTGLPGEVTVVHDRTDYGRAYAADGFKAVFRKGGSWPVPLDSHGIKTMHGNYRKEKS